jgi:hypothetical protein
MRAATSGQVADPRDEARAGRGDDVGYLRLMIGIGLTPKLVVALLDNAKIVVAREHDRPPVLIGSCRDSSSGTGDAGINIILSLENVGV